MSRVLSPETFLADLQPGDTAFHGMLYPGVYPAPLDEKLHEDALAGREVYFRTEFSEFMKGLVAKQVSVQWLRVIPIEGALAAPWKDVLAMQAGATAIARACGADVRVIDFEQAVTAMLREKTSRLQPVYESYLHGAACREPRSNFWRLDTAAGKPALVSMMDYTNGVFDGHAPQTAPLPPELVAYTDFWRHLYDTQAFPVRA